MKILGGCFLVLGALVILVLLLLAACSDTALPHRSPGELFPQAVSPDAACPDQYAERVTIPDQYGTLFLYCWGGKST